MLISKECSLGYASITLNPRDDGVFNRVLFDYLCLFDYLFDYL